MTSSVRAANAPRWREVLQRPGRQVSGASRSSEDTEPSPDPRPSQDVTQGRLRYQHVDLAKLSTSESLVVWERMGEVIIEATRHADGTDWAVTDWASRVERTSRQPKAYLVWDGDELVAFTLYESFPYAGRTCIHMQSGYVRPSHQRGGIGFSISARVAYRSVLSRPWGEFLLVSDMLNPVVMAGWIARFPKVTRMYPAAFGRPSAELRDLAPLVAEDMYPWARYDAEHSVLKGRTTPRSDFVQLSGNKVVDEYFTAHMDSTTGDTVLLLAEFDHLTVIRGLRELLGTTPRMLDRRVRRHGPGRAGRNDGTGSRRR